MLIRSDQLGAELARKLQPIYTVYGDEPLLVIEACDAIRAAARKNGFSEREVLTALPGFSWSTLYHCANNMSLFGDKKLIDLRIPSGKPGREGSEALQKYCARPAQDTILLITLPGLNFSDEKAVWLKTLLDAGAVIKPQAPAFNALPAWIAARLKTQGQSAEADSLYFIAERVEGNLLAAHQEILKLGLLYPAGKISFDDVKEAVFNVARYDLDGLREALLEGDVTRFTRALDGLAQEGEPPPLVLWALVEEIRALVQVKSGLAERRPLDSLLKEARVWGTRQRLFKSALERIRGAQAAKALIHATKIDAMIKGIGVGDVWNEFLRLGLLLTEHQKR